MCEGRRGREGEKHTPKPHPHCKLNQVDPVSKHDWEAVMIENSEE